MLYLSSTSSPHQHHAAELVAAVASSLTFLCLTNQQADDHYSLSGLGGALYAATGLCHLDLAGTVSDGVATALAALTLLTHLDLPDALDLSDALDNPGAQALASILATLPLVHLDVRGARAASNTLTQLVSAVYASPA
jgi:hypothetical protein